MTRFIERLKEEKERVTQKIWAVIDERTIDREARKILKISWELNHGVSKETVDEVHNQTMSNPNLSESTKEFMEHCKRISDRAFEIRDARQQNAEA